MEYQPNSGERWHPLLRLHTLGELPHDQSRARCHVIREGSRVGRSHSRHGANRRRWSTTLLLGTTGTRSRVGGSSSQRHRRRQPDRLHLLHIQRLHRASPSQQLRVTKGLRLLRLHD
jgi:hypothetical protein